MSLRSYQTLSLMSLISQSRSTTRNFRCNSKTLILRNLSTSVNHGGESWDIGVGVVIERPVVISPPLTHSEIAYKNLLETREFELSLKNEFELKRQQEEQKRAELTLIDGGGGDSYNKSGSATAADSLLTTTDMEDEWQRDLDNFHSTYQSHIDELQSQASKCSNTSTLNRHFDRVLWYVCRPTESESNSYDNECESWQIPWAKLDQSNHQSLLDVAKTALTNWIHPDMKVRMMGRVPVGLYSHVYPKSVASEVKKRGLKMFLMMGELRYDMRKSSVENISKAVMVKGVENQWVTHEELNHMKNLNIDLFKSFKHITYSDV